jgi:uncharacterized protein YceH (UPF0502 family)
MTGKAGPTRDVVATTVGEKVSENFWAILFAGVAAWFGWLSAFETDLEARVDVLQNKVSALAERVARLEGQTGKDK